MEDYFKIDLVFVSFFFGVIIFVSGIARFFIADKIMEINIIIVLFGLCLIILSAILDFVS